MNGPVFKSESFWRYLANIWTILFLILIIFDFVYLGRFSYLLGPFSLIYGSILSFFVGTKEFSRWNKMYQSKKHPGEISVIIWTLVILAMFIYSVIMDGQYRVSPEVVSVYIMVLTLFVISQKSKNLYKSD